MIENIMMAIAIPIYNNSETLEETIFSSLNHKTKPVKKSLQRFLS